MSVFDIILGDKMSIFDHEVATVSILDMVFEAKQRRCPFLTVFDHEVAKVSIFDMILEAKRPRCSF